MQANRNNRGSVPGKASDEWRTPLKVIRAIERHLGVQFIADMAATKDNALCPIYFTKEDDTLTMLLPALLERIYAGHKDPDPNIHALFCNPPYKATGLLPWMERAKAVVERIQLPWVFLLPGSRTEQPWFHVIPADELNLTCMKERIAYLRADGSAGTSPNHPSIGLALPGGNNRIKGGAFSHLDWKAA